MSAYKKLDAVFEKISGAINRLFAHLLVFVAAFAFIIYWFWIHDWSTMTRTDTVRDIILAITFLSFFIIQKSFSHFSAALHLKLNELVAAHDKARNDLIKAEEKSSEELKELGKEHDRIIEQTSDNKTKPES